jgi:hypothetical protein
MLVGNRTINYEKFEDAFGSAREGNLDSMKMILLDNPEQMKKYQDEVTKLSVFRLTH